MKFSTGQCVKEVLCDIAPPNSCHLFGDGHGFILMNMMEKKVEKQGV